MFNGFEVSAHAGSSFISLFLSKIRTNTFSLTFECWFLGWLCARKMHRLKSDQFKK